jgi:hypothetical protein
LFPRAAPPENVPLPQVDARVIARVVDDDRARAARVARDPLPSDVRELGSDIRELNRREAKGADASAIALARNAIDRAVPAVLRDHGAAALLDLRAAQLEAFLTAVRRYEEAGSAGQPGDELAELAGSFVPRMNDAGWCDAATHRCLLDEDERRVAFKVTWNGVAGVGARTELAPTVDEMRVLYTFYLLHPHVGEREKGIVAAARAAATTSKDPVACFSAAERERAALEAWRLDKVNRLGAIDHDYPLAFARGVVQYRMGKFEASAASFQTWLDAHPDGAFALRARNHLKAAIEAAR